MTKTRKDSNDVPMSEAEWTAWLERGHSAEKPLPWVIEARKRREILQDPGTRFLGTLRDNVILDEMRDRLNLDPLASLLSLRLMPSAWVLPHLAIAMTDRPELWRVGHRVPRVRILVELRKKRAGRPSEAVVQVEIAQEFMRLRAKGISYEDAINDLAARKWSDGKHRGEKMVEASIRRVNEVVERASESMRWSGPGPEPESWPNLPLKLEQFDTYDLIRELKAGTGRSIEEMLEEIKILYPD